MRRLAMTAGFEHSRENGPTFDEWWASIPYEEKLAAGLASRSSNNSARKKADQKYGESLRVAFDRGVSHAEQTMVGNDEPDQLMRQEPVTESYFGHFHEREKKLMAEENALMEGGKGGDVDKCLICFSSNGDQMGGKVFTNGCHCSAWFHRHCLQQWEIAKEPKKSPRTCPHCRVEYLEVLSCESVEFLFRPHANKLEQLEREKDLLEKVFLNFKVSKFRIVYTFSAMHHFFLSEFN